ncbi:SDR family oxidoreductase [Actinoplanes sp. M2I2]|uniref:SDR family NAD(P)-dependent oxidoreductase n=1 Tax=Actinoplanes sp. M2I2 TaxID=1734444 RepID=UPI002020A388|nr:SDR family NAD(P)-dependent oxidoreductase [Actinoplanes sp. M2I2]
MFDGKTALVTGASRGLGREFALELARRGARPVLLARSAGPLRELADEIRERHGGPAPEVLVADLTAPDGPEQVLRQLHDRGLAVDLLVNNAAIGAQGPFLSRSLGPQLQSVGLNVTSLLTLTHTIAADMVARGSGGIIVVTSGAAFTPMGYLASYGATKAFQLYFTEALAQELQGTGVRVMGAHPGDMETSFGEGVTAPIDPNADKPAVVAAQILDDYARNRAASYPGKTLNRVLTWPARVLPRVTVARLGTAYSRRRGLDKLADQR